MISLRGTVPLTVSWILCVCLATAAEKATPKPIRYGKPRLLCTLACKKVKESSGVTHSRRNPGVFWTHNDSGDDAKLFAFDKKGRHLGTYTVAGADNRDWEEIASVSVDGKHFLLICDTGDNDRTRPFVTLYLAPSRPWTRTGR